MRSISCLSLALFATSLCAQSPLSLPFAQNNGLGINSQILFDLTVLDPAGVTITALDVNSSSAAGTTGSIEVYTTPTTYLGQELNASAWAMVANGPVVAAGVNLPSPTCLGQGFYLAPGSYGVAVRHVNVALSYTNGTGANQTASTLELAIACGASEGLFTGVINTPRVFNGNIYYNVGNVPGAGCAGKLIYGTGCYDGATTFYENFASLPAFDFPGSPGAEQVLHGTPIGAQGYVVTTSGSAWHAPTGSQVLTNATVPVAMGDDSMSQPLNLPFSFPFPGGSTSVVHAAANGFVVLGSTTATTSDFTPTSAELVSQDPRLLPLWCDLQPAINVTTNAASGVYFDIDASNQIAYVTWLDVADRRGAVPVAGATSVNVQVALFATGEFEFRYGTITPNAAGTGVVFTAFSKGNAGGSNARDPGSIDLSASLPLTTMGPDSIPLTLDSNYPRLGAQFTHTVTNVPNLVPLAFVFIGSGQLPGIDLATVGAPSCKAWSTADLASGTLPVTLPAGTGTLTFGIPNNPTLTGLSLTSQAVAFTLANSLNLVTSNGRLWTVGN